MEKFLENYKKELVEKIQELNLPKGEYIIAASGALAIRGIREAKDIDVVVSEKLWNELKNKHEVIIENGIEKIVPSKNVEVLWEGSFDKVNNGKKFGPSADEQIIRAETFGDFSFQNIRDCLWFKVNSDKEKDKKDLELAKEYFIDHPEEKSKIDFEI